MEGFDFHSLLRKDLQALCKLNKIPANITNVAMADSLQALHQVEGLDELIEALSSDPNRSVHGTPMVPQSARRGSVRRNPSAAVVEPETLTRTRRTAKKSAAPEAGGCPPQTPATAVSRRKTSVTAETSKFNLEAGDEVSSVQKVYSTRRSVRLLGKTVEKMCLKETVVQQNEVVAAGADSSIDLKEETDESCRNLDFFLESETDVKDAVSADSLNEVLSLDSEDGKDKEMNLPKAEDTEDSAADVNHFTDKNMVESSNPDTEPETIHEEVAIVETNAEMETGSYPVESFDASSTVEKPEAAIVETETSHELQLNDMNNTDSSSAEMETGSSTVEKPEAAIVETETSHELQLNDKNNTDSSSAEMETGSYPSDASLESSDESMQQPEAAIVETEPAVKTPIRPALRSVIVMGSNSHRQSSPASPEDSSDEEEESDEDSSDDMEEVIPPSEIVLNKENIVEEEEKKRLNDMSVRQLTKMLKEKLALKNEGKTEKRQALAENCNNGC
ncbi:hypothetical protein LINPERHAP2_LOCUS43536 [Linum perenne]